MFIQLGYGIPMTRLIVFLTALFSLAAAGYEIPIGVVGIGELEKAQEEAKLSGRPVVLVVAIKTQPET